MGFRISAVITDGISGAHIFAFAGSEGLARLIRLLSKLHSINNIRRPTDIAPIFRYHQYSIFPPGLLHKDTSPGFTPTALLGVIFNELPIHQHSLPDLPVSPTVPERNSRLTEREKELIDEWRAKGYEYKRIATALRRHISTI